MVKFCTVQFLLLPPHPNATSGTKSALLPMGFLSGLGSGVGQVEIPTRAKTYGSTQWLEPRGVLGGLLER